MGICACQNPPFHFERYAVDLLGEDSAGAEVSLLTCKQCGRIWLKYFIDEPHYARAGRWWHVAVTPEQRANLSADNARDFIQAQKEGFVGGSYFDSVGLKIHAPITIA